MTPAAKLACQAYHLFVFVGDSVLLGPWLTDLAGLRNGPISIDAVTLDATKSLTLRVPVLEVVRQSRQKSQFYWAYFYYRIVD